MATNYDELTKKRYQTALERYYKLKNAGNSGNNYKGIATPTSQAPNNDMMGVQQAAEEKKNKGGFLGGLGYLGHELGLGVMRSLEGIVDYTVGGVADLFGADAFADEIMKNDWVNYNAADEWYNPGAGWELAGDFANGLGGVLPAVAVSYIPGVGQAAGAAIGGTMFFGGAAGNAVSEQTKKSGTAGDKEWRYGTGVGLLETGIELASGGIGGTAAGKVLGKQLAKSTGGKIATSFIGEGLEEVASDILDPALQRVTGVDKNAQVDWNNLPRTFLLGGGIGAVMGGGQRALSAAQAGGFNNLNAMEGAQEINERMSDNNVRKALGKKEIYTQKDIAEARDRLSANLQRMDENTRATFLKQAGPRVSSFFNADGTVKQEVWENRTNSQSIGNLADVSYSASLKGRESTLKYQPVSDVSKVNADVQKAMRNIELLTGGRVDIVITADDMLTADGQQANGEYADGVIYVNANADSYERAMFVMSHELTHTLENTEQYGRLGAFIREQINENSDFAKQYNLDKYRLAYANAQAGDFSAETLDYQAETEMYADFVAREILGNEEVVRRLVAKERNIAVRFLEWVRSAVRRMGGGRVNSAEYATLKKTEKLLSAALENAKGGVTLEDVEKDIQRMRALRDRAEVKSETKSVESETQEVKSETKSVESETQEVKKETTEEKSVEVDAQSARYSIEKTFSEQVDEVIAGTFDKENSHIRVSAHTPSIYVEKADMRDLPILMSYDKLCISLFEDGNLSDHYHNLGEEIIKQIPKAIENPIYILSGQTNNRIEAILTLKDKKDRDVFAVIEFDSKGRYKGKFIEANILVTAFGAKDKYIQKKLETRKILYEEKRNSSSQVNPRGQFPSVINENESSTTIIRENTEKSTENAKKVEKSSRKSLDVDSAAAKNAERKKKIKAILRKHINRMEITDETKERLRATYGETVAQRIIDTWENTSSEEGVKAKAVLEKLDEQGEYLDLYYDSDILATMEEMSREEALKRVGKEKAAAFQEIVQAETSIEKISKEEAGRLVNNLLAKYMDYEESLGKIGGKTKAEVVGMLTDKMNAIEPWNWKSRERLARQIADYIINHTVFENIYAEMSGGYGDAVAVDLLSAHAKSAVKQDLAKEILREFNKRINVSQLEKKFEKYEKRIKNLKNTLKRERDTSYYKNRVTLKARQLKDVENAKFANASEMHIRRFKKSIGLLGKISYVGNLNKSGTRKALFSLSNWYTKENPMIGEVYYNEEIAETLKQLADNSFPLDDDFFKKIEELEKKSGKTDYEGLYRWYTHANVKSVGLKYDDDTQFYLKKLADPTEFSTEELMALEHVIDYFKKFMGNYNKVYRAGKYVEAAPIAEKYVAQMQKLSRVKVGWMRKWFEKYLKSFADPMTVARYFDRYEDGFFTEALEDLRRGAIQAQVMEQRLRAPLEEFYDKHKKFLEESEKHEIEYQGEKLNAQAAMLLYMTLKREQALRGLAYSGFKFKRGDYTVTAAPFATAENLDIDELKLQAAELQNELAKQFTESEREYVAIIEKIFNEDCKKAKSETDMARMGYTNISEGYYVPIRRASIAYNVEKQTYKDELASVSDQSFNKDTVAGARNQLFIDGLTQVAEKHINGISQYSALAVALDNYNVLFNLNVSGNPNMSISVKSEADNVWPQGGAYFSEMINDIKGVKKTLGVGGEYVSRVRGAYAKYQLGANLKVLATQFSSFAAAINILDPDCIIGGVGLGWKDSKGAKLDKYCGLALVRNSENTAAMAQGVLEKTTNKIGDVLMKPIGTVDRLVVKGLFGACQMQVEKKGGAKVGTEENLTAAGELLEKVILETQQNAMATERSAAMRSGHEFMKTITMFSADSMKLTGRVVDAIGETAVLRTKLRNETDAATIATLKDKLAAADKQARRAIASVVLQALFMTVLAEGFKWLYDKEREEDENIALTLAADTFGNMIGGLPFIRDVYSFFADGFGVESYAYSSLNDMLAALGEARDLAVAVLSGQKIDNGRDLALTVRKTAYAAGQLTGIPTRNIYNMLYGLTKRVSPSAAYKINDKFYKSSYRADLAKAIEKGDDKMIATIVGLMLNENVGGVTDKAAREAIDALMTADYDVIPRSVPDKLSYKSNGADGTEETIEMELTAKQAKAFEKVYIVANDKLASLVKTSQFKSASQEAQAKAVDFIYDTYYDMAKCGLTGEGMTKNALFAEAIGIDKLAIIIAEAKLIEADKKNGVTVSGSKKAKVQKYVNSLRLTAVQKYMIMGYLGYKNVNGAAQVQAYINRLNLSKEAKAALYQYSGYGE